MSKDISGQKFGRLTAISRTNDKGCGDSYVWLCKCECGKNAYVSINSLTMGKTKSCGCLAIETKKASKTNYKNNERMRNEAHDKAGFHNDTCISFIKSHKLGKRNRTGVKGVGIDSRTGKYRPRLFIQGREISLPLCNTLEEAKRVRLEAEEKYFKPIIDDFNGKEEK